MVGEGVSTDGGGSWGNHPKWLQNYSAIKKCKYYGVHRAQNQKKFFIFPEVTRFCSVENAVEELVFYLVAVILNEIVSQIWIVKFILKLDLFQIYFKQIWHSSMNSNLIRYNVLTWNGLRSPQIKSNFIR